MTLLFDSSELRLATFTGCCKWADILADWQNLLVVEKWADILADG